MIGVRGRVGVFGDGDGRGEENWAEQNGGGLVGAKVMKLVWVTGGGGGGGGIICT